MEPFLASVFLSLSTNLDNFAIAFACGIRKLTIRLPANLLIASLSGLSTYIAISLGNWLGLFTPNLSRTLGSSILIALGLLSTWRTLSAPAASNREESYTLPQNFDETLIEVNASECIGFKEAFILGLALTMTNFGTGIGAGMAQLNAELTSCFSFLSSLLTIGSGSYLGRLIVFNSPNGTLELVSGFLLISLGVYEYFS